MIESHLAWIIPSGVLVTLIIFVIKNGKDNDNRINRVYERIDEVKTDHDGKFQNKEMCSVYHKQINDSINEIKVDVKMLLRQANGT